MAARQRAAIVGVHNTRQARHLPEETSDSITFKAVRGALADAGLTFADVDGYSVVPGFDAHSRASGLFGYSVGNTMFWAGSGRIGPAAVNEAAQVIEAGGATTVVVASGQAGLLTDTTAVAPWTRPANEYVQCFGLMTPAEWALSAQEYIWRFGTKPEELAYIASVIRNNGHRNPEAVYYGRGPYTVEDILASRMVASPYRLLECATVGEGGSALVLTTLERARDLVQKPVEILGHAFETWGGIYQQPQTYDRVRDWGRTSGDKAFAMAGLQREDVDVFEFYDNFSWEIIRYFESLGYCGEGEGAQFVADGAIESDGRYPICTDGGVMAHSHTGISQLLQKVVQGVRQIRGTSAANQVPGAEIALVANLGEVTLLGPAS